jgi:polyisoprenoid-binding protein YceI
MKTQFLAGLVALSTVSASLLPTMAYADDYKIDTKGAHAAIQFKIKHLGYSWLVGRFNTFDGDFSFDATKKNASKIDVKIITSSIDSNHAERDKHLKSNDFLDVKTFPEAKFKSTDIQFTSDEDAKVTGIFTLKGVSKKINFDINKIGEGKDPWGGYRVGFEGKVNLKLADYDISYNLGPASTHVEMSLYIEGIKQ